MKTARDIVAADPALARNLDLLRTITGFCGISATILLAELPNIADFAPSSVGRRLIRRPKDRQPAGRRRA